MSEKEFVPNEVLAGRSIRFWAQFTEKELIEDWKLNEAQIVELKKQLAQVDLSIRAKTKLQEQAEARGETASEQQVPPDEEPTAKKKTKK